MKTLYLSGSCPWTLPAFPLCGKAGRVHLLRSWHWLKVSLQQCPPSSWETWYSFTMSVPQKLHLVSWTRSPPVSFCLFKLLLPTHTLTKKTLSSPLTGSPSEFKCPIQHSFLYLHPARVIFELQIYSQLSHSLPSPSCCFSLDDSTSPWLLFLFLSCHQHFTLHPAIRTIL